MRHLVTANQQRSTIWSGMEAHTACIMRDWISVATLLAVTRTTPPSPRVPDSLRVMGDNDFFRFCYLTAAVEAFPVPVVAIPSLPVGSVISVVESRGYPSRLPIPTESVEDPEELRIRNTYSIYHLIKSWSMAPYARGEIALTRFRLISRYHLFQHNLNNRCVTTAEEQNLMDNLNRNARL